MAKFYEIEKGINIVAAMPVLYIPSKDILVFADTHLGFEEEMARQGVFIPRAQLKKIFKVLDKVFSIIGRNVSKIIINGDLKHSFDRLSKQERIEVRQLIEYLLNKTKELILIRGNHDNFLPIILKEYGIELTMYHVEFVNNVKILFTHGHVVVDEEGDIIIIGHEHPSVALVDKLGLLTKVSCFLKVPLSKGGILIILPSLGAYQAGTRISLAKNSYLSPYVREFGIIEEAIPYAIIEGEGILPLPKLSQLSSILEE